MEDRPLLFYLLGASFAALCALNCWSISSADHQREKGNAQWNLVSFYPKSEALLLPVSFLFTVLLLIPCFVFQPDAWKGFLVLALSSASLLLLTWKYRGRQELSLLADYALLWPLPLLFTF